MEGSAVKHEHRTNVDDEIVEARWRETSGAVFLCLILITLGAAVAIAAIVWG